MRKAVLGVAMSNGYAVEMRSVAAANLAEFDTVFITNTSSKIMPIKSINEHTFNNISPELKELMEKCGEFLLSSKGKLG